MSNASAAPIRPLQADAEKQKQVLAGFQTARATVSSAVAGLLGANIDGANPEIPLRAASAGLSQGGTQTGQPALQEQFEKVRQNALHWSNDVEPALTAIPQAIINFSSKFQASASSIQSWVKELTSGDESHKSSLLATLDWLAKQIDAETRTIGAIAAQSKTLHSQFVADYGNFTSADAASGQGVDSVLAGLVESAGNLVEALQAILDMWGALKARLAIARNDLASAPGADVGKIAGRFDLTASLAEWNQLKNFATTLQYPGPRP
jgi:hypothetical protein